MIAISREIRQWVVLLFAAYLVFTVVIPAISVLLFAEQMANDAIQSTISYVGSWWY